MGKIAIMLVSIKPQRGLGSPVKLKSEKRIFNNLHDYEIPVKMLK